MESKEAAHDRGEAATGGGFDILGARELLAKLSSLPPSPGHEVLSASLIAFGSQLQQLESLHATQAMLAHEYGLADAALHSCCALPPALPGAPYNRLDPVADPSGSRGGTAGTSGGGHDQQFAAASDIFTIADGLLEREDIQALAWQANCPVEAVRRELRAFQKAVSDRLSIATRRAKLPDRPGQQQQALSARAGVPSGPSGPATAPPSLGSGRAAAAAAAASAADADAAAFCLESETEQSSRRFQLAKLGTLLLPETGGISGTPVSVVGVFQQLLCLLSDWRVRVAALEAMRASALDVLWRLLQNSRVLDTLHAWLQDALSDGQASMLRLMLDTMALLPMRRDLLKGSRLEAALEGLVGGGGSGSGSGGAPRAAGGGDAMAADDGAALAGLRRRFGGAAAAVLAEWRKDPDAATILRRAGAPVPESLLNGRPGGGPPQAAPSAPGSRLLGAAAAEAAARKRALAVAAMDAPPGLAAPAPPAATMTAARQAQGPGNLRGAPRPRVAAAAADPGAATAAVRRSLASPPPPQSGVTDMTAKLGETGRVDPDVVHGFRSRLGDGSVRRSQLARPAPRAAPAATAAPPAAPLPVAATATAGRPAPSTPVMAGAATARSAALDAAAAAGDRGGAELDTDLDAEAVARLRAQRAAQRHAAALAALAAEARRLPEVAEAEAAHRQRAEEHRAARARQRAVEAAGWAPGAVLSALASPALRESVPWVGPPPELLMPPPHPETNRPAALGAYGISVELAVSVGPPQSLYDQQRAPPVAHVSQRAPYSLGRGGVNGRGGGSGRSNGSSVAGPPPPMTRDHRMQVPYLDDRGRPYPLDPVYGQGVRQMRDPLGGRPLREASPEFGGYGGGGCHWRSPSGES
ncbi:SYP8 protein [Gonium pectorale]|uniref:SYP8 protein n=1 Tax=Gonium pectorale TaxID=33097 RepID=A0A150GGG4_GONPE|nr:SYP8 protein [Gonium pectorale]|eukprot:KXZ48918.1 SYP8 protein [Gonium pectorale]